MKPLISIIIPNYNHAEYLKQRFDTVLNQTYKNFEIIILDDFSDDQSREVIKQYEFHPSIKAIVLNDKNSGNPFQQWKKGVDLASGEWLWIAESDDYAELDFLEVMIQAIAANPSVGLVYSDSFIVENNRPRSETFASLKNRNLKTNRWSTGHFNNGKDEILNFLLPHGTINNTSAVLFNREVFMRANPFDVSFRYIGDKYAFIKVLAIADIYYVSRTLNYFRNPFNSKHTGRYFIYAYEHFIVYDWVMKNLSVDNKILRAAFYSNTEQSLLRGWNAEKVMLLKKMFTRNPYLFAMNIGHNLVRSLRNLV